MGFSDGTFGYVCGGTNGDFFNDLWKYDPNADSWTELTALPASGRSGAAAFVIGQTAYIVGGRDENNNALDEVWAYEMASDEWTQLSDTCHLAEGGELRVLHKTKLATCVLDGMKTRSFGLNSMHTTRQQIFGRNYRLFQERDSRMLPWCRLMISL